MVKKLAGKIKPKRGFAHLFHISLVAIMPILVYVFVRLELPIVAFAIILLSKWRIFAVRPRHWPAHFRTNAVDIIFGLSVLAFMTNTSSMGLQILWVVIFELWLLYIKPGTSAFLVSIQALIAQIMGLTAIFIAFETAGAAVYMLLAASILYFSARHYFGSFEEPYYNAYSLSWATVGASVVWVLSHWLLFIGPVAQPAILLGILSYGLGSLYYLHETDRLSKLIQWQVTFVMLIAVVGLLLVGKWTVSGL